MPQGKSVDDYIEEGADYGSEQTCGDVPPVLQDWRLPSELPDPPGSIKVRGRRKLHRPRTTLRLLPLLYEPPACDNWSMIPIRGSHREIRMNKTTPPRRMIMIGSIAEVRLSN